MEAGGGWGDYRDLHAVSVDGGFILVAVAGFSGGTVFAETDGLGGASGGCGEACVVLVAAAHDVGVVGAGLFCACLLSGAYLGASELLLSLLPRQLLLLLTLRPRHYLYLLIHLILISQILLNLLEMYMSWITNPFLRKLLLTLARVISLRAFLTYSRLALIIIDVFLVLRIIYAAVGLPTHSGPLTTVLIALIFQHLFFCALLVF